VDRERCVRGIVFFVFFLFGKNQNVAQMFLFDLSISLVDCLSRYCENY